MLKGTRKLNKTISNELNNFGIAHCVLGTEYSYSFEKNDIMYKLELTIEDKLFSDFIYERFGFDDTGMEFIISILHEVGHSKANEEIEGDIYEFCESEKQRIAKEMNTAQTEEEVKKLAEKMKKSSLILLTDYRGINVEDVTELRKKVREANGSYNVIRINPSFFLRSCLFLSFLIYTHHGSHHTGHIHGIFLYGNWIAG